MTAIVGLVEVIYMGLLAQKKFRARYFWPSIFKDCVKVVKQFHPCQFYTRKMHGHLATHFLVITFGPFTKWGINFTTCNMLGC